MTGHNLTVEVENLRLQRPQLGAESKQAGAECYGRIINTSSEAFLLGCFAQRFPGERFEWDSAAGRVTNSEKATKYLDTPARSAYRV